jgi:hypothetical protein
LKAPTIFGGNIVFALFFREGNDWDLVLFDEGVHLTQEGVGHDPQQRGGSNRLTAMESEETGGLFFRWQLWLVDVEVHAIDALDFQDHVPVKDLGNAAWYTHDWLRSTKVLRTATASGGQTLGLRKQTPPIDRRLFYQPEAKHASSV